MSSDSSGGGGSGSGGGGPLAALQTIGTALLDLGRSALQTLSTIASALAPFLFLFLVFGVVSLVVSALHVPVLETSEVVYRCTVYPFYQLYEPLLEAFVELYELLVCWSNSFGLFNRLLSQRIIFGTLRECPAEYNINSADLVRAVVDLLRRYALALGSWLGTGPISNVLPIYTVVDGLQTTAAAYIQALVCLCEALRPLWDALRRIVVSPRLACAAHQLGNALGGSIQALLGWGFRLFRAIPGLIFNGATTFAAIRDAIFLGTGAYAAPNPLPYLERAALGSIALGEFANDAVGAVVCTVVAEIETGGTNQTLSDLAFAACMAPGNATCDAWAAEDPAAASSETCADRPRRRLNWFGWAGTLGAAAARLVGALIQLLAHIGLVVQQFFALPAGPRFLDSSSNTAPSWQIDLFWDTLRPPSMAVGPTRITGANQELYPNESGVSSTFCTALTGVPRDRIGCREGCTTVLGRTTVQEELCELASQLDDLLEPLLERRIVSPILCCLPRGILRGVVAVLKFVLDALRAAGAGFDHLPAFAVARSRWTAVTDELIGRVPVLGGLLDCVCQILDAIDHRLHCVCAVITHPLKSLGETLRLAWEAIPASINTVARVTGLAFYEPSEPTLDELYCLDRGSRCYDLEWRIFRWLRTPRPIGDEFTVVTARTITEVDIFFENVTVFPGVFLNISLEYTLILGQSLPQPPSGTWDLHTIQLLNGTRIWYNPFVVIDTDGTDEPIPEEIDGVLVIQYELLLQQVEFIPPIILEFPRLNITTFDRETGMPSFAYVPKGAGCREPTSVAVGEADELKLALIPVGYPDDTGGFLNLDSFADLFDNKGGYAEIVLVGDEVTGTWDADTLRLVQGAHQIDNWHDLFWSFAAELFLEPDSPLTFEATTPLLVVNGTLQYALVPTPLIPGGARLDLRECGAIECLCRILSVDYLNEFLPADQQIDAAAFPDICCGLEAGLRALVEVAKTVAEFFLALLQTYVDAVNGDPADIVLRWISCTGSGVGQTGPPAVCSPLPFLLSDLDDFLGCPCDVLDTFTIAGRPIPCLCTLFDNLALGLSDLVRSALVLASATTYSIECADAGFPDPECTVVLEDRFVFAFTYVQSALDYLAETGGGIGCVLGQLFVGSRCKDGRAGNFGSCPADLTVIDLETCIGAIPEKVTPIARTCFLGLGSILLDVEDDKQYVFVDSECGCTPVFRFQRLFERLVDILAVLVRVPLNLLILFVDSLVTGSTSGFNFAGPRDLANLLRETLRDITTPIWGRELTGASDDETEDDYGAIQLVGLLMNCLIGPEPCSAPGQPGDPCVGNFFIVTGNVLRAFTSPVLDLVSTLVGSVVGFLVDPEEAIDLFIGIFYNDIPCIITALFDNIEQVFDFAVSIIVAIVRLFLGSDVASIVEFVLDTVTGAVVWFLSVINDIVTFLQDALGLKRSTQFFHTDASLLALFSPENLAKGLGNDADFCARVLRQYGDAWVSPGGIFSSGAGALSLEQEGLVRACYGAAVLPGLWNLAVNDTRIELEAGAEPVASPWTGAPPLPPDVLTNVTTLVRTIQDVATTIALYAQYRDQRGNQTTLFIDTNAGPGGAPDYEHPTVYQNMTSFDELVVAHGIDPATSFGVAWVRFYEDRVQRSVIARDVSLMSAAAHAYVTGPNSTLKRALGSVGSYADSLKRGMHDNYERWLASTHDTTHHLAPTANATATGNATRPPTPTGPTSRWAALQLAATTWYDQQQQATAERLARVEGAAHAYLARHPESTARFAQRLSYLQARVPESVAAELTPATEAFWAAAHENAPSVPQKRQDPVQCDPFAPDANCTQCALLDELLSETRNIFEFCYQVRILNNTDFIEPVDNTSLCVAPLDPNNTYVSWYNETGLAEGTILRTVVDWLNELAGCDVLLSPATYLFELNNDPQAGPTGFLFDFLPLYGRCDRDAHLLCQKGYGVGAGLVAAAVATGGVLVVLAFVAPPLASIWNFGLGLLGVSTIALAVFTNVAWGYSWRCAGSPGGLLTSYVLPISVPTFLLPECAARDVKEFVDSFFPDGCWPFLEPLVVNGTVACPTCPQTVQLNGCATFGITSGGAAFGYFAELVGAGDVIRIVAEVLPFLDALLGLTDAIGGPLGGLNLTLGNVTLNATLPDVPPVCQVVGFLEAIPYFILLLSTLAIAVALLAFVIQVVRSAFAILRGSQQAVQASDQSDDDGSPPPIAEDTVPPTLIDANGRTRPMYIGTTATARPRPTAVQENADASRHRTRAIVGANEHFADENEPFAQLLARLIDDGSSSLRHRGRRQQGETQPRARMDGVVMDNPGSDDALNAHYD